MPTFSLTSQLLGGDQLLQDIANDVNRVRISKNRNRQGPSVEKVQRALLLWDPDCLPGYGADGVFGTEAANAVHRFKVEELRVPEPEVVDDVGPLTVRRLDEIARRHEQREIPAELIAAKSAVELAILALPGVEAIGIGRRDDSDELAVRIFVEDASLVPPGIPSEIGGVGVVITEGIATPCGLPTPDENAYGLPGDPAGFNALKGGIQIGSQSVPGPGTLGAAVKDRRTGKHVGLTCMHVAGDSGSTVTQPQQLHLAIPNPDIAKRVLGKVIRAEMPRPDPLVAGAIVSDLDAAVFALDTAAQHGRAIVTAIVGEEPGGANLVDGVTRVDEPRLNQVVRKRGFRSHVTKGIVDCLHATVCWKPGKDLYGRPDVYLVNQVLVLGMLGHPDNPSNVFSESGDSGSLVLDEQSSTAVGLLYGKISRNDRQGPRYGIVTRMTAVELRLDISAVVLP